MSMLNKYNDVLTVEELCEVLRIGKNTAYRLLKSNEINSVKIGKIYKIPKKSVRKYLEKNT
jgi:excisionase family DNA binding protein